MTDETFNNSARRVVWVFLGLAGAFLALGALPLIIGVVMSLWRPVHAWGGLAVGLFVAAPLALSMLIAAAMTWPVARATDRAFDSFRRGEVLARWEYPAEMWETYIQADARQRRKNGWVVLACVFLPLLGLSIWIGWAVPQTLRWKLGLTGISTGTMLILAWASYGLVSLLIRQRQTRLRGCPRAYLGRTAIYCGGEFNFWGSQLRGLQSVGIEQARSPGETDRLVFIIGLSKRIRRVARVVDAASAAALQPAGISNYTIRQEIPILPGAEKQAEAILRELRAFV